MKKFNVPGIWWLIFAIIEAALFVFAVYRAITGDWNANATCVAGLYDTGALGAALGVAASFSLAIFFRKRRSMPVPKLWYVLTAPGIVFIASTIVVFVELLPSEMGLNYTPVFSDELFRMIFAWVEARGCPIII